MAMVFWESTVLGQQFLQRQHQHRFHHHHHPLICGGRSLSLLRLPSSILPHLSPRAFCRAGSGINDPLSHEATLQLKLSLRESLKGINRGIFGVPAAQKAAIEQWIKLLEHRNPIKRPTEHLEKVKGEWRLLYSTISILGLKRTKLGLRDFITLGDFLQIIDVEKSKAANTITFSVAGLGMLSGALTIEASYVVSSASRVNIQFENSSIVPEQLLKLFQKNYDLLLSIFNPEGWLEITYIDDEMRVGRDDKGNIFVLERKMDTSR